MIEIEGLEADARDRPLWIRQGADKGANRRELARTRPAGSGVRRLLYQRLHVCLRTYADGSVFIRIEKVAGSIPASSTPVCDLRFCFGGVSLCEPQTMITIGYSRLCSVRRDQGQRCGGAASAKPHRTALLTDRTALVHADHRGDRRKRIGDLAANEARRKLDA
jgi:hypothetical protein